VARPSTRLAVSNARITQPPGLLTASALRVTASLAESEGEGGKD
jgi:hypothetical protein